MRSSYCAPLTSKHMLQWGLTCSRARTDTWISLTKSSGAFFTLFCVCSNFCSRFAGCVRPSKRLWIHFSSVFGQWVGLLRKLWRSLLWKLTHLGHWKKKEKLPSLYTTVLGSNFPDNFLWLGFICLAVCVGKGNCEVISPPTIMAKYHQCDDLH